MEKIFLVKNSDLTDVNTCLENGGRVKAIHAVAESVSAYGCVSGGSSGYYHDKYTGNIFAYVVVDV